jgi:hypothetical protein
MSGGVLAMNGRQRVVGGCIKRPISRLSLLMRGDQLHLSTSKNCSLARGDRSLEKDAAKAFLALACSSIGIGSAL